MAQTLAPFLGLSDADARDYLAEYVVYREKPGEAGTDGLREKVNEDLKGAEKDVELMAAMAVAQGVAWAQLLDEDIRTTLIASLRDDDGQR